GVGEAKLARQVVRQAQENGDRFFQLVLENKDTDVPAFRRGRAEQLIAAQEHYESLVEVYGDAPDFIVSTANAFFFLGRIYDEVGQFGKALGAFGEAERRYMAILNDSGEAGAQFVENLAIAKASLGRLALKQGQYSVARHYFTESTHFWTEARSRDPQRTLGSKVEIHLNSLAIAECELSMGHPEAALDSARSVGMQLIELQEENPEDDRITGALARSFGLTGRVLEGNEEGDLALESFQQSSDIYAEAIRLNASVDQYHLGLGISLARVGLLTNDIDKLDASVEVLVNVISSNPFDAASQKTLADVYGVLASNQRDGGRLQNAVNLEREAISLLRPLIEANELVPNDLLFSYSQRLAHLAELLGDAGEFDESRIPLREAIAALETVTLSPTAQPSHHRALARAQGLAGFACMKTGDTDSAREHLELARNKWERYMAAYPDDTDAVRAAQWTSDQLSRL
ncbi:MAG: hypothetical protein AAF236_14485, partial [Verrucomicrobiota bacterium]